MICIYHNDMDGKCSAAIVKKYYSNIDVELIDINYNRPFPWNKIAGQDVVLVDFTVQPYVDMAALKKKSKSLIWIDHHKTAIEEVECISIGGEKIDIPGLRLKDDGAACELTWQYFFPNSFAPLAVNLVGDHDTWKFKFEETKDFHYGTDVEDMNPDSPIWDKLLSDNHPEIINTIVNNGKIINRYNNNQWAQRIKNGSFDITLNGKKGLACNFWGTGSDLFNSIQNIYNKYDFVSVFSYNGKNWTVSLYTENKDIDVSKLASAYGGGGHKGAAGFVCKTLPF